MHSPQSQMAHILGSSQHYPVLFHPTHTVSIIKYQTKDSGMAGKHARYNILKETQVQHLQHSTNVSVLFDMHAIGLSMLQTVPSDLKVGQKPDVIGEEVLYVCVAL